MNALMTKTEDVRKGRKKPPVRTGVALSVYLDKALRESIDKMVDETSPRPSITAIVEAALEMYLTDKGYWPPEDAES